MGREDIRWTARWNCTGVVEGVDSAQKPGPAIARLENAN